MSINPGLRGVPKIRIREATLELPIKVGELQNSFRPSTVEPVFLDFLDMQWQTT